MKKLFLSAAMCCASLLAMAAGPICGETLTCEQTSPACPDPTVYVKWETTSNGNVDITVFKDGQTAWRGRGMADAVTADKGWSMTIDGTAVNIADYFEKEYTSSANQATAPSVYTLKLKEGVTRPTGTVVINFVPTANICWWNAADNNGWGKHSFSYLYGSVCEGIAAPTNVAVSAESVITFDAVAGATGYTATVKMGDTPIYDLSVNSGDILPRPTLAAATYMVTVCAISANGSSDPSDEATWTLTDASVPAEELPGNNFCSAELGSGSSLAYQTWSVNAHGDIVISISGNGATWRSTAFKGVQNFKVGMVNASVYFEEEYTTGSTEYTLKLKEGAQVALGETITFKGTAQWLTADNSNCYQQNMTLTYIYGTSCPALSAPTVSSIDANKHITFSGAEGAETYAVRIYHDGDLYAHLTDIHQGDSLTFGVFADAPYTVEAQAMAAGMIDSEWSAPYTWNPATETFDGGTSEMCDDKKFESQTWDGGPTNLADSDIRMHINTIHGNIVIELTPVVASDVVTFRQTETDGGLSIASFYVNGAPAEQFFTLSEEGATCTLTPIEGHVLPFGMRINYSGKMQWSVAGKYENAYHTSAKFGHVYGTTCSPDIDPYPVTDGLENISNNGTATKVILDGHLFIIREGRTFDSLGHEVK